MPFKPEREILKKLPGGGIMLLTIPKIPRRKKTFLSGDIAKKRSRVIRSVGKAIDLGPRKKSDKEFKARAISSNKTNLK